MPHFLNLLKVKPLEFKVTEGHALTMLTSPKALASIQITRVPENPLHVQPLCVRFEDQSVAACFFEKDGSFISETQLLPAANTKTCHVPEEARRIPMPHIHPDDTLEKKCLALKKERIDMSPDSWNSHFHLIQPRKHKGDK